MAKRYYRPPGYSPRYTRRQTAFYVSRAARMTRGFRITPSYQQGDRYYFRSSRGPRATGGYWIVQAGRAASGGPSFPPFNPEQPYGRPGQPMGLLAYMDHGESRFMRGTYVLMGCGVRTQRAGSHEALSAYEYYKPFLRQAGFSESDIENDIHPINSRASDPDGRRIRITSYRKNFTGGQSVSIDPYRDPYAVTRIYSCGEPELFFNTGGPANDPFNPPPATEATTYTCTCPDFTHQEQPYQTPIAPSQQRARQWEPIRPNFPCKHIVAAAVAANDVASIMQWAREAQGDLPARAFWRETYQNYQNWLNRNQAQRAEQERQRRERDRGLQERDQAREPQASPLTFQNPSQLPEPRWRTLPPPPPRPEVPQSFLAEHGSHLQFGHTNNPWVVADTNASAPRHAINDATTALEHWDRIILEPGEEAWQPFSEPSPEPYDELDGDYISDDVNY